jgi:hypothetical protein
MKGNVYRRFSKAMTDTADILKLFLAKRMGDV